MVQVTSSPMVFTEADVKAVTALRMLSVDQVEKANSGHPGLPLGMAPTLYSLFSRFMKHDPSQPDWFNRDRFVLSAGHGSALLYSALHLFGYALSLDDLKAFRQWDSLTPGHPEHGHTPGVEVTTGPLGQGIATSVGLALAERMLAARLNPLASSEIVDHYTFVIASDGDLMEGLSHEAASLAGHLGLGRLIVFFDDNSITIDGPATNSCSDNVEERFSSYGWQTLTVSDGNDLEDIASATEQAIAEDGRPSLIRVRTIIGYGAPTKAGKSIAHGAPLGAGEMAATKAFYSWPSDPTFFVPEDTRAYLEDLTQGLRQERENWEGQLAVELASSSEFREIWELHSNNQLQISSGIADLFETGESLATRAASQRIIQALTKEHANLVGGSADLAESTGTKFASLPISRDTFDGNEIRFGIREHAMAACSNGIALHGGFRPFCSTFLVFSDYLRPSVRLSALMGLPVVYLFSHDSVAVGEDGPTHQPVEHLAALRSIPNLAVIRPADGFETAEAWSFAGGNSAGPTALILTRQALPNQERTPSGWLAAYGARIVVDIEDARAAILASGSEVAVAVEAAHRLNERGMRVRVLSVPWRERFAALDREELSHLGALDIPRVVVEAGTKMGWEGIAGESGKIISIDRFGASGPGALVMEKLGVSVDAVCAAVEEVIGLHVETSLGVQPDTFGPSLVSGVLLEATEAAAVACQPWIGRGEKELADDAAVRAMRKVLAALPGSGVVVVGEGEKDEAPMLHIGENLGGGSSPQFDIAVDPLEGTNYCAKGQSGSISVVAMAPRGSMWTTQAHYMEKLVVSAKASGSIDIEAPIEENLRQVALALGKCIAELSVVVLAKPRHVELMSRIRATGARVVEIPDGDVMASISVLVGTEGFDLLAGVGGAPEGVISACATRIMGGEMQCRLAPQSDVEAGALNEASPLWSTEILTHNDLVSGDCVVALSAVTGAPPLASPSRMGDSWMVHSMVLEDGRLRSFHRVARHTVGKDDPDNTQLSYSEEEN